MRVKTCTCVFGARCFILVFLGTLDSAMLAPVLETEGGNERCPLYLTVGSNEDLIIRFVNYSASFLQLNCYTLYQGCGEMQIDLNATHSTAERQIINQLNVL